METIAALGFAVVVALILCCMSSGGPPDAFQG
jgi:hypothetical protein